LRFGGASIVTDVYLNGQHLGQHRGAFGAFCFELTPHWRPGGPNELRVRVDNAKTEDVPPVSGDFTMFGGIYRPVELIATPATCISSIDRASPGVRIFQLAVSAERAEVTVKVALLSLEETAGEIRLVVLDAGGKPVQTVRQAIKIAAGETSVSVPCSVEAPHLWNGVKDPYLYQLRAELMRGGKATDAVTQPLGFRAIGFDPKRGILLNGVPYAVRGVNRHQDREGKGWAISEQDEEEDMRLIKEMGVTAVRLAHYPHSTSFYSLCDREGLLVWAEIPLVNAVRDSEGFRANTRQQLQEMIWQHGNHPSIALWGLFNELAGPTAELAEPLVKDLQRIAKEEDPHRLTVGAGYRLTPDFLRNIADLVAFNSYPRWYDYKPDRPLPELFEDWNRSGHDRGVGLSEYGAGGSIHHHEDLPARAPFHLGLWHPEEYQAQVHEFNYRQITESPVVWGSFVWNMFDFAAAGRDEGDREGINDKGLVTYDRKTPKDAYYFYKANWNPNPSLYLASKRHTVRHAERVTIKAYARGGDVELFVNDRSQGSKTPGQFQTVEWENVRLEPGPNEIRVEMQAGGSRLIDASRWERRAVTESGIRAASERPGAEAAADGNFGTRWLADSSQTYPSLTLDLGHRVKLDAISILWWRGANRDIEFWLEGSEDGQTFRKVFTGESRRNGRPAVYRFPETAIRFLRLSGKTNHKDGEFGVLEVQSGGGKWPEH